MTHYSLIVGHDFSLSDETNHDVMTDYFPGIWAIKTQKSAMRFAKEILARGDTIRVTDYDNPVYHALANKFIKELGLNQPLFIEPKPLKSSVVSNGKPATLNALKKYLKVDTKIHITNYDYNGNIRDERDTFVKKVQTQSVVLDKLGGNSWFEFGKATDWIFNNDYAIKTYIDRDGAVKYSSKLTY